MKIVVITQEDRFFIPRNVAMICREPGFVVQEIIVLDAKGSLVNMRTKLIRWFGVGSFARLAWRMARQKAASLLGRHRDPASLQEVAHRYGVPYSVEHNANADDLLERLEALQPDVVVSFSAPQVFGNRLLSLPRLGCVNLHCSLLPKYRGLLPSFWVLHNGEKVSGATVHYMAANLDDGDILTQRSVDISNYRTMYEVLDSTKHLGGELMIEALRGLRDNTIKSRPNPAAESSYYTWPRDEDVRRFREAGFRLA